MSKSKSFRRKLQQNRVGFVYYRIWGWPLDSINLDYFEGKVKDSNGKSAIVGLQPNTHVYLYVERCVSSGKLPMTSLFPSSKSKRSAMLSGAVTQADHFHKEHQALRALKDFIEGRRDNELRYLCRYHRDLDVIDSIWAL